MKNYLFSLFVFIFATSAQANVSPFSKVNFIVGCWTYENGQAINVENWMRPIGTTMMAITLSTNQKQQTKSYELLKLELEDNGNLTYTPTNGVRSFTYDAKLSRVDRGFRAAFINRDANFPQLITYTREFEGGQKMTVRLVGKRENGRPLIVEYPLFETGCQKFY